MNNDQTYDHLRAKYLNKTFSQEDAAQLVELGENAKCHLEALLFLIECSHYKETLFSKRWDEYYQCIVEEVSTCLIASDMAQIHSLASTLYQYDQNKEMARLAIRRAYELDKESVRIVFSYMINCWDELKDKDRKAMIDNLDKLDPQNAFTYFAQGWLYNTLSRSTGFETSGRALLEAAIAAYKKSLSLGLNQVRDRFPPVAATSEIKRIEGLLAQYD